ncbi:MAG TPA: hypothetical protein VGS41_06260, partial [Chthonomonadales bacterium]|nr:hypothetical protein [Chthonomonadales bacterium]
MFYRAVRKGKRASGLIAVLGLACGIAWVYRWAEPAGSPNYSLSRIQPAGEASIRLVNTAFSSSAAGHRTYSLWAGEIDIDRMPGMGLSNIQAATIHNIRNGVLYEPGSPSGGVPALKGSQGSESGAVAATFHADQGRYSVGNLDPVATDIALLYTVRWQFKLTGDVLFQTVRGEKLRAQSIDILDMVERRTGKAERRVLCDSGAAVSLQDATIHAGYARYDPAGRTVDCLDGVRGAFRDGSLQSDRMFWQLAQGDIRCPGPASGVYRGADFTGQGVVIDLHRRTLEANSFQGVIRNQDEDLGIAASSGRNGPGARKPKMMNGGKQRSGIKRAAQWTLAGQLLLSPNAFGAAQNPSTAVQKPSPPKQAIITGSDWFDNAATGVGSGHNVTYQEEDRKLSAELVRYNRKTRIIDAEGKLVFDDNTYHATGDRARVDDGKNKLAVITGNVVLTLKPTEETPAPDSETAETGQSARAHGVVVTCDRVEDYFGRKYAILRGHLVFRQQFADSDGKTIKRELNAEHAEYDGAKELMYLYKPVDGKETPGREVH